MLGELSRNWWLVLLRGLLAILFGIIAFVVPEATFLALVWIFGAYAIVDGVLAIVAAIRGDDRRIPFLIEGVLGIAAGVIAFLQPVLAGLALIWIIAAWAIVTGVFEIAAAIRLRDEIDNEWMLGLAGVLSVVFGVLIFLFPAIGALSVIYLIGFYAVLFGVLLVALAFRLRGLGERLDTAASTTTGPRPAA